MSRPHLVTVCVLILLGARSAWGEEAPQEIKVAHGRFDPAQIVVPANTAFKVRVTNADTAAIEFESFELHRERVVQPGETITVFMPAVAPGTYPFFDDFHRETPAGAIVARSPE
ncbi:MAG: cupredoxin domain-containing protein [Candidatus Binatia bacterium]